MKWGYKTVHFELKKEGLLGGSFLDEAEIEEQLNDFGRSGWELISVIEVQQGIICFFKQPLQRPSSSFVPEAEGAGADEAGYDDHLAYELVEDEEDDQDLSEAADDVRYREYDERYIDAGDPYVVDDDYGEEETDGRSADRDNEADEGGEGAENDEDDREDERGRGIGEIRIE